MIMNAMKTNVTGEPGAQLISTIEACSILGVTSPTLYKLIKEGKIRSVKLRRARRIDIESLRSFISSLPEK